MFAPSDFFSESSDELAEDGNGFTPQDFQPRFFQDAATRKACMEFLGFNPDADGSFQWIVDKAMNSSLPPGWRLYLNESTGQRAFINPQESARRVIRPFAPSYRQELQSQRSQHRPLKSDLSDSPQLSDHATSESIDREFELGDLARSHDERIRDLKKRQAAELAEEQKLLAVIQQRRKQRLAELQTLEEGRTDMREIEGHNETALEKLRLDHETVVRQHQQMHEREIEKLKAKQKAELGQWVGEIEALRAQRLKKAMSDREKYRNVIQRFVGSVEDEEQGPFEDEMNEIRERQEKLLFQIKSAYERVVEEEQMKLQEARAQGEHELMLLKASLEQKRLIVIKEHEREMLNEKKKGLERKLQQRKKILRIWSAKPIFVPPSVVIHEPKARAAGGDSGSVSATEVPPFGSLPRNHSKGNQNGTDPAHLWMLNSDEYARRPKGAVNSPRHEPLVHPFYVPGPDGFPVDTRRTRTPPRPGARRILGRPVQSESESGSESESESEDSLAVRLDDFKHAVASARRTEKRVRKEFHGARRAMGKR
jgi:hypothetical protein